MPEEIKEVKTFSVKYNCSACGNEMVFGGITLTSNPPQYPHICSYCGNKETLKKKYPYQYFVIIE